MYFGVGEEGGILEELFYTVHPRTQIISKYMVPFYFKIFFRGVYVQTAALYFMVPFSAGYKVYDRGTQLPQVRCPCSEQWTGAAEGAECPHQPFT